MSGVGPDEAGTPASEWVAASIGALALLGMVGFLLWRGFVGEDGPPELAVRVEAVERAGDAWLVRFVAINDGPRAAAAVQVSGKIGHDGSSEESAVVLDYLPQRSERRGGLIFSRDPGPEPPELRAEGYIEP